MCISSRRTNARFLDASDVYYRNSSCKFWLRPNRLWTCLNDSDDMFPQMAFKILQQFPTAPLDVINAYLFAQIHKHDDFRRKITSDNKLLPIKPPCLTPNKPPMECLVANENWLREPQSITVTTSFRVHVFLRWEWLKTMSENILIYCFFDWLLCFD